jgi:tRNA(fMet)-specific endonuclease VapC
VKLLLDTNRYSDLAEGDSQAEAVLSSADEIFFPFITVAELQLGFRLGARRLENEKRLTRFFKEFGVGVLYPTANTLDFFADLKLQLRRQGTPIPDHDIWIAALALQHGLTLYARDKHFDHLSQLARI